LVDDAGRVHLSWRVVRDVEQ